MKENTIETGFKGFSGICSSLTNMQMDLPKKLSVIPELNEEETEHQLMEVYAKQHAPLTTAFHQEWKGHVFVHSYSLPTEKASSKWYTSRYECETAAKEAVRQAYELANKYVTAAESKSVSRTVAEEYAALLKGVFTAHQEALQSCCMLLNKQDEFQKIVQLVNQCEKNLRSKYEEELMNSWEYYKMYRMDYFYDKIEIEEHDNRISDGMLLRAFEALFTDNIEYTYSGVWDAILELEKDLNENLTTFYRRAHAEYMDYIAEIEILLDSLDDAFCKQISSAKQESPIMAAISNMMKQENG